MTRDELRAAATALECYFHSFADDCQGGGGPSEAANLTGWDFGLEAYTGSETAKNVDALIDNTLRSFFRAAGLEKQYEDGRTEGLCK